MPDRSGPMSGQDGSNGSAKSSDKHAGPEFKRPIDPQRVLQILECKRKVLEFVESMLEPEVTLEELKAGEELICRIDYDSIAQERHILKICGYPLCSNGLTKEWKQRYHVSLRDKRIYDVEVRKLYCSVRCMETSLKYRDEHVPEQPIWMRLEDIRMGPSDIDTNRDSAFSK
jgi:hypothetical protein